MESPMTDAAVVERPATLPAPGSAFPDIKFATVTVKVTVAATFPMKTEEDAAMVKDAVENALEELRTIEGGNVTVNYERLP
jgi:hypothetical protein